MGIFSLFTPKTANTAIEEGASIIKTGMQMIDDKNFTPEEKARYHKQLIDAQLKNNELKWAHKSDIRSRARYTIALIWMIPFTIFTFGMFLPFLIWGTPQQVESFLRVLTFATPIALTITGFYYGGEMLLNKDKK